MVRRRLDAELVRRGLARSRQDASDLVAAGRVKVAGVVATKTATQVDASVALTVSDAVEQPPGGPYASRGATKLLGALDAFMPEGLQVADRRCLDAGASTGGFTDVLLRRGAAQVIAVDVGYGQLAWRLHSDPRVVVRDRTNVRDLTSEHTGGPVDLVVADLSFISLRLVLPSLLAVTRDDADLVLMVKPQFEVGKQRLPSGGVVRDPELRRDAVLGVIESAADLALNVRGVTASPLPGPSGNVEYFLWLHRDAQSPEGTDPAVDVAAQVDRAIREGPT
jgi:23S rRNA (cytidine1920-2'-O)/16S rRNA (cytidine1409-2'-O)-methyltransferase